VTTTAQALARRRLLATGIGWAGLTALGAVLARAPAQAQEQAQEQAQALPPSEARLQQLMQARRGQLTPEAARERLALLARGEALMAAGELDAAQATFDSAALMLHAADTEIALVRCYMQRGEYQRAISFGAHAAGAHRDVSEGAVLYAWLLQVGGQGAFAQRLLDEALQLRPGDALLDQARAALRQQPLSAGLLPPTSLMPGLPGLPVRLGPLPLGDATPMAIALRVVATATWLGAGGLVLAPLSALNALNTATDPTTLWLRDGLGRTATATLKQRWPDLGLALLAAPGLADAPGPAWAARDAFPGSPAYTVEHVAAAEAAPAWPQLRQGFLGGLRPDGSRALGLDLPRGPRGGPVFDLQGRIVGLALAHDDGTDRLLPLSLLRSHLDLPGPTSNAGPAPRLAMAAVYEMALPLALQVISA
jgi:tetratricopeptide (TPR) repeat protein